jgi:RNA polymerase sigma-70 factor (ECF subfamily)
VEAYLSLATYRGKSPFKHWLCRIATHTGYGYWRKRDAQRKRNTVSLAEWDQEKITAAERLAPDEAGEKLYELLEMLGPRDRLVLTLRYLDRKSIKETAKLTGWSGSMVKVQTWRATNKLRRLFEQNARSVSLK